MKIKRFETQVIFGWMLTLVVALASPATAATLFEEEFNTAAGAEFYTSAPYNTNTWRERVLYTNVGASNAIDWSTSGGQLVAMQGGGFVQDDNYSLEVDVAVPGGVISNDEPITIEISNTNNDQDHSQGPTAGNVVTVSNRANSNINLRTWTEWSNINTQTTDIGHASNTDPLIMRMTLNHSQGVVSSIDMQTQVGANISTPLNFTVNGGDSAQDGNLKRLDFSAGILPVGVQFASGDDTSFDYIRVTTPGPAGPDPLDFTWVQDSFGEWITAGNWSPGSGPPGDPNGIGFANHTATFGGAITANKTVSTETAVSARSITFDNVNTYSIAGSGSVNLIAPTAAGLSTAITGMQGTHQFQAAVNLHTDTTVNIASDSTLIFNNALDLNNNVLTKTGTGELAIRNDFLTSGGTLNCAEGTCSGSGTISGDVNNNGGTISPGNSSGGQSVIPEPTTLLLVMIGAMSLCTFRRTFRRKE